MDGKRFLNLMDMFDGGGAGQAGSEFKGGPLSGLLNMLGIKPFGGGRGGEMAASPQPMPRPMPAPMPAPVAPVVPPVSAAPLAPSMEEIIAALSAAPRAPYASPGAPMSYPTLQEIMAMQEAERMAAAARMRQAPLIAWNQQ